MRESRQRGLRRAAPHRTATRRVPRKGCKAEPVIRQFREGAGAEYGRQLSEGAGYGGHKRDLTGFHKAVRCRSAMATGPECLFQIILRLSRKTFTRRGSGWDERIMARNHPKIGVACF